jgi:hypothetical protein
VAGPVIARTGRYKIYPAIGAILTGACMAGLAAATAASSALAIIVPMVFAGAGIGLFVQVALLAGQNAVDHRDLGTAAGTGTLSFFKSIGGTVPRCSARSWPMA